MKICIYAGPFYPSLGGVEEISRILGLEFAKASHEVEIITWTPAPQLENSQFPFAISRTTSPLQLWRAFRQCDVALFMNVSLRGLPVAVIAGCPLIISHHITYDANQKNVFRRFLQMLKPQVTRFFQNISVSQFVASQLPCRSVVIPNAYDSDHFTISSANKTRDFVFCGRVVAEKGVVILLQALSDVVALYPDATLSIIGDGTERTALETMSEEGGLSKNIAFLGALRGPPLAEALRMHSCMVIPSIWEEPFGIVALEGIASCASVIATNRGGLPEAVGDCGVLVEPTRKSLANAMMAAVRAIRKAEQLPGQPELEIRRAHLAKHERRAVAKAYLSACKKAANSF